MEGRLFAFSIALSALLLYQFGFFSRRQEVNEIDLSDVTAPEVLQEHTKEFNKTVIKVCTEQPVLYSIHI